MDFYRISKKLIDFYRLLSNVIDYRYYRLTTPGLYYLKNRSVLGCSPIFCNSPPIANPLSAIMLSEIFEGDHLQRFLILPSSLRVNRENHF